MSKNQPNAPVEPFERGDHIEPRHRKLILLASIAAAVLVSAAVVAVFVFTPGAAPWAVKPATPNSPAPSAHVDAPISSGEAEGVGALSENNASSIISTVFNVKTTDTDTAAALQTKLADTVKGNYLAELEAQQQELLVNGWKITGDAKIVSTVVDKIYTKKDQTRAKVTSCIDTSKTKMVDVDGKPLPKPAGDSRALHIFTLQQNSDGTWAVTKHTFPNDPKC